MYCVLCETKCCADWSDWKTVRENVILYAESLSDAAQQIDKYYGNDCYAVNFTFIKEEGELFTVSNSEAKKLREEASPNE